MDLVSPNTEDLLDTPLVRLRKLEKLAKNPSCPFIESLPLILSVEETLKRCNGSAHFIFGIKGETVRKKLRRLKAKFKQLAIENWMQDWRQINSDGMYPPLEYSLRVYQDIRSAIAAELIAEDDLVQWFNHEKFKDRLRTIAHQSLPRQLTALINGELVLDYAIKLAQTIDEAIDLGVIRASDLRLVDGAIITRPEINFLLQSMYNKRAGIRDEYNREVLRKRLEQINSGHQTELNIFGEELREVKSFVHPLVRKAIGGTSK